jgi:O-antigen biosynthesis protein
MSADRAIDVTPGFLPATAFAHAGSVAVGMIDLEPPAHLAVMSGGEEPYEDALLLVRLHGDPLGIVHLRGERPLACDADELAIRAQKQLEARIRCHKRRFDCAVREPARAREASVPLPGSVAVVIATVGRTDLLARCLRSLTPFARDDVEIIVVDNRPAEQTRALVANWSERDLGVRYIAEPRRGLAVARNRGVAQTRAEFVAFTDDDVIVDPGWLPWLLAPFADASVLVATGMVLPLELETAAQKQFEQYAGFCKGVDRHVFDLQSNRADDRLLYPYWGGIFGSGNSMAFRRAELVQTGGFDPALGAGSIGRSGEDIDAISHAILSGGRVVYEPRSLCWHEHRRDQQALGGQVFNYGAGLTAALTKAVLHDPRFLLAAARSIPVAWRLRRRHSLQGPRPAAAPPELAHIERRGMLRGPLLYAKSVAAVRRLGLRDVIRGG